ncbi:uncharacterized protein KY384_004377 [Bacidia gigantensis]|uniref:uncharacterized protein n=1 Tax=Bacidia gigantensis TaxID=2732470 RepID=UPI001D04C3A3|nr:uncharacterized protein KY384_004377 [Bacidia gigantensis]KAG8531020.1 hypothetical protein KY384_004377 [Bacidia gigantensis]
MAENHGGGWQMETVDSERYMLILCTRLTETNQEETGAQFINVYNVPGRTIVAAYNVHPVASTQGEPPININGQQVNWQQRLPNVQKWSDVTGIIWVDKAGSAVGNLKYVFRQAIVTDTTKATMNEAFERSGSRIGSNGKYEKRWPGYTYNAGSEEFAALLGTLHGTGVAFLIFTTPDVNNDYHQLWTLSG